MSPTITNVENIKWVLPQSERKNLSNQNKIYIPKDAKMHPTLRLWCTPSGEIYSALTGEIRKQALRKDGYTQLSVKRSSYLCHRIILETFREIPEGKTFVNHKNGIKHDNSLDNLEWLSQLENVRHARDVLGVKYSVSGMQHPSSKFKESHQVILRNLFEMGFPKAQIAKIMGFSIPTIERHLYEITRTSL